MYTVLSCKFLKKFPVRTPSIFPSDGLFRGPSGVRWYVYTGTHSSLSLPTHLLGTERLRYSPSVRSSFSTCGPQGTEILPESETGRWRDPSTPSSRLCHYPKCRIVDSGNQLIHWTSTSRHVTQEYQPCVLFFRISYLVPFLLSLTTLHLSSFKIIPPVPSEWLFYYKLVSKPPPFPLSAFLR